MAVTITDVARTAGVSPSTVSRALSVPHKVGPGTRERVLRVAEHLGYQPNRAARSLITGRTGNLLSASCCGCSAGRPPRGRLSSASPPGSSSGRAPGRLPPRPLTPPAARRGP